MEQPSRKVRDFEVTRIAALAICKRETVRKFLKRPERMLPATRPGRWRRGDRRFLAVNSAKRFPPASVSSRIDIDSVRPTWDGPVSASRGELSNRGGLSCFGAFWRWL